SSSPRQEQVVTLVHVVLNHQLPLQNAVACVVPMVVIVGLEIPLDQRVLEQRQQNQVQM
ncbi:hypothetical protein J6590_096803, partial [Homalodisca vitripennis]